MMSCLPQLLCAQRWNVSANGGVVMNTITSKHPNTEKVSGPGSTVNLQAGYVYRGWEMGLSAAYRQYSVTQDGYYYFEDDFDPLTGYLVGTPTHMVYKEKMQGIAIAPFVSRHFGQGRTDWYAGIQAGYIMMLDETKTIELQPGSFMTPVKQGNGLTAGVHGGCSYKFWRNWSLRGELAVDGVWLKDFSFQGAGATAGLQYSIE
jgi:hypothetical protein